MFWTFWKSSRSKFCFYWLLKQCFATWTNCRTSFVKHLVLACKAVCFSFLAIVCQTFFCSRQAEIVHELFQKHHARNVASFGLSSNVLRLAQTRKHYSIRKCLTNNVWSFFQVQKFAKQELWIGRCQTIKHCWSNIWDLLYKQFLTVWTDSKTKTCLAMFLENFKAFLARGNQKMLDEQCFATRQNAQTLLDKQIWNVWPTAFYRFARALRRVETLKHCLISKFPMFVKHCLVVFSGSKVRKTGTLNRPLPNYQLLLVKHFRFTVWTRSKTKICLAMFLENFKAFLARGNQKMLDEQCFATRQNAQTLLDKQISDVRQTMFGRFFRVYRLDTEQNKNLLGNVFGILQTFKHCLICKCQMLAKPRQTMFDRLANALCAHKRSRISKLGLE